MENESKSHRPGVRELLIKLVTTPLVLVILKAGDILDQLEEMKQVKTTKNSSVHP